MFFDRKYGSQLYKYRHLLMKAASGKNMQPFWLAYQNKEPLDELRLMVKEGPIGNNDWYGGSLGTLFEAALLQRNQELLSWLMAYYPKILKTHGNNGNTPLHWAVIKNDFNLSKAILNYDIDINALNMAGETPLHLAARNRNPKMIQLLQEKGADSHLPDNKKKTAYEIIHPVSSRLPLEPETLHSRLMDAVQRRRLDLIKKQTENGTKLPYPLDPFLQVAFECEANEEILRFFIKNGADIKKKDVKGKSLLSMAVEQHRSLELIHYLLQKGLLDKNYRLYCREAVNAGYVNAVKFLFAFTPSEYRKDTIEDLKNYIVNEPSLQKPGIVEIALDYLSPTFFGLSDNPRDLKAKEAGDYFKNQSTEKLLIEADCLAAMAPFPTKNLLEIVEQAVKYRCHEGGKALQKLSKNSSELPSYLPFLIYIAAAHELQIPSEKQVKWRSYFHLNSCFPDGKTVLDMAASHHNPSIIHVLKKWGADPEFKNQSGCQAFAYLDRMHPHYLATRHALGIAPLSHLAINILLSKDKLSLSSSEKTGTLPEKLCLQPFVAQELKRREEAQHLKESSVT